MDKISPAPELVAQTVAAARRQAFEEAARVCEADAARLDDILPDGSGGLFTKRFAKNALLSTAGLIRKRAKE